MISLTYSELERVVTFSHGGNWKKQGGRVTLMWLAALSSGLVVLWCGHVVLWRKQKKKERVDKAYWM